MSTNNSSEVIFLLSPGELQFFNVSLPIISIVGLFINVVVIWVIVTDRGMRQTTASIYIVNLAVADILVLIVGVPLWIYQLVSKNAEDWSCQLTFGLSYVTSVVSVLTLAIISYDRFHCVMQPFSQDSGKRLAYKVVSISWLVGSFLAIPFFVGYKAQHHEVTFQISAFCVYTRFFRQEVMITDLIIIVLLIIISTYFYYKLCRVARAQAALIKKDLKLLRVNVI
uniref:G-protein coupled receptors family 1 profile domain-containing protein n=1 Tax=Clytia hemisphaerica TaxID=252671 RepID=A0A7M5XCP3_9CNID